MAKCKATTLLGHFESRFVPCPATGCWLWTGWLNGGGYGEFINVATADAGKPAHRVAWLLYRGPIPRGMLVLHHCDVRCCVNPGHLFLGTYIDNMDDMMNKGRRNPPVGERQWMSKLTAVQVLQIRGSKDRPIDIARRYGVSDCTIHDILKRRHWKHI